MMIPAILNNMDMTLNNPLQSQTKTYEWSSTPVKDQNGKESDYRLCSGISVFGGAGHLIMNKKNMDSRLKGFRLAILLD